MPITRVRIIASYFANCEVNSSYCDCKIVNYTKIAKQFISKENLIFPRIFPRYIHNSSIAY